MDAGWFTAIGAVAGAVGTGAKDFVLGWQKQKSEKADREAKARDAENQRQHEKDEREAQAKWDRKAATRAERAARIAEWRTGLSAAHRADMAWQAQMRADLLRQAMDPGSGEQRPNALTAVWLQSLWPYLGPCPRVLDTLNPGLFLGEAR